MGSLDCGKGRPRPEGPGVTGPAGGTGQLQRSSDSVFLRPCLPSAIVALVVEIVLMMAKG